MKTINKILTICLIFNSMNIIGQCTPTTITDECSEGKGIFTNPSSPLNPECDNFKNYFDWKLMNPNANAEYFTIYKSSTANDIQQIWNPFIGPTDADYHQWVTGGGGSFDPNNYYPEDGWELIKVNFGVYDPDPMKGLYPKLPYLILYNKYTATMRFFGSLIEPDDVFETVEIKLTIPEKTTLLNENYQDGLKANSMLSIQGKSIQPLDQETKETIQKVYVKYTNNPAVFFWFDIPIAYDACICKYKSQLDISFAFVQTADIELTGILPGEIKTQQKGNDEYGKMVFSRILGAVGSTVTGIVTGGSIINVKSYIDLIDIFKNNPNTSTIDRESLGQFKDYINCGNNFYSVLDKNLDKLSSTDSLKQYDAASKIIDGATTYMSSFINNCSEKKESGATYSSDTIKISGSATSTVSINNTKIQLMTPGSKWDLSTYPEYQKTVNGLIVPAYPTYNERLGTFALLRTPTFNMFTSNDQCYLNGTSYLAKNVGYSFRQSESLSYTFNPKLNLDKSKTKILARVVIDRINGPLANGKYDILNTTCISNTAYKTPLNIEYYPESSFKYTSPYVDLDFLGSMPFRMDFSSLGARVPTIENLENSMYLQIKILGVSNDIGHNGKQNTFYQVLTFPIKLNTVTSDPNFVLASNENYKQGAKIYYSDVQFVDDQTLYFEGPVMIKSKLSTVTGKKVKIFSMNGFIVTDNGEISPDIELIPGMHLSATPQPEAQDFMVNSFCSNPNIYKAHVFGVAATSEQAQENIKINQSIEKSKTTFFSKVYPNPATTTFTVSLSFTQGNPYEISITDITGKLIETKYGNGDELIKNFNTEKFSDGIYLVKIICNGTQRVHKLVIQNSSYN